MGTLIIGKIIDRARNTLLELNAAPDVRWARTGDLLDHANEAQNAICLAKPDAYTRSIGVELTPGAKQLLPADAQFLFNIEHNLGNDGATPGRAISLIDRQGLSSINPNWMVKTGAAVEHYLYDQRDNACFYVYPRPVGIWWVNALYPAVPPIVLAADIDTTAIVVNDTYDTPIHDFIVGRAFLKSFKAGDINRSQAFMAMFDSAIGKKQVAKDTYTPLDARAAELTPQGIGKS